MKKRVRAIILENDSVLLIHRIKKNDDYWVFPGGGMEDTDASEKEALKRECLEELGVDVSVEKFFDSRTFELFGKMQEQIFYLCKIIGGEVGTGRGPEYANDGRYEGKHIPEWMSMTDMKVKDVRPVFIKNKLLGMNSSFQNN